MITFLVFMLFSGIFHTSESHAGEVRAIELKDGSIVTGEVVSLTNGKYTVRSGSLGTLQIEESKVLAIKPHAVPAAANPRETSGASAAEVSALQDMMMNDKEIMSKIQLLQNDPEFLKIIEDPEIMKAVNSGDISALMANPRFLKLMSNPAIQDIEKKVK